jgi:hypothetical protein
MQKNIDERFLRFRSLIIGKKIREGKGVPKNASYSEAQNISSGFAITITFIIHACTMFLMIK